jgi:hypothetical protein
VAELEPGRDEEPSPAFSGYVKMRENYEDLLQDLEMRRIECHERTT